MPILACNPRLGGTRTVIYADPSVIRARPATVGAGPDC